MEPARLRAHHLLPFVLRDFKLAQPVSLRKRDLNLGLSNSARPASFLGLPMRNFPGGHQPNFMCKASLSHSSPARAPRASSTGASAALFEPGGVSFFSREASAPAPEPGRLMNPAKRRTSSDRDDSHCCQHHRAFAEDSTRGAAAPC